jgi:hypothetical protein
MKKTPGILLPLILWAPLLFAQGKFIATASKTNVAVGERFQIDFSLNANGARFTPPDLSAFYLLTGPNLATNENIANGDTTFDNTYSYILAATKEGTFTIDRAVITVNGYITLLSNPLKIKVKGQLSADQLAMQQVNVTNPDVDKDNVIATPAGIKNLAEQIFVKVEVDKVHVYVGEQIKVAYKLYTRVNLAGGKVVKSPDLKGFREQDVPNPAGQKNTWTKENVNGMKYNVANIKQFVIFPKHTGNLTIGLFSMATVLQIPVKEGTLNNPTDNYKEYKYEVKSAPVIIHVVARPSKSVKQGIKG